MTNTDLGAPEYEYDWQNPDRKNFDFGRTFTRTIDILKLRGIKMMVLSFVFLALPFILISIWPIFLAVGMQDLIVSDDPSDIFDMFSGGMIALVGIGFLIVIIASLWLQPALIKISYSAMTNEDMPSVSVLKQVTRFVLPVLGFYILYFFAVMFGLVLLIIPALFTSAFNGPPPRRFFISAIPSRLPTGSPRSIST